MTKNLKALSLAILLGSTSAMAGGSHQGTYTSSNQNYNNAPANSDYSSSNMTMFGKPTYFYAGGELGWLNGDSSDDFWTAAPLVGLRIGQYFGVEASYTWSTTEDVSPTVDTDVQTAAIDGLGYIPISADNRWNLVGTVGVGRYQTDNSGVGGDDDDTALRFGGGVQYELSNNWSSRVLYRHATADTALINNPDTVTWGLTYNFR